MRPTKLGDPNNESGIMALSPSRSSADRNRSKKRNKKKRNNKRRNKKRNKKRSKRRNKRKSKKKNKKRSKKRSNLYKKSKKLAFKFHYIGQLIQNIAELKVN